MARSGRPDFAVSHCERGAKVLASPVTEKVPFSFAAEKAAGAQEWRGRKLKGTRSELNRNEAFGYAF